MTAPAARRRPRPRRFAPRPRAVVSMFLAAAALVVGTAIPAGASWWWWWWYAAPPTTAATTTTAPTTTTTRATTTTTTAPTTTTTTRATTTTTAPTTIAAPTSTAAPTTTTTAAPAVPCGGSLPKAGGGTWTCSWADEFEGTSLDPTRWLAQETATSGFTQGGGCFVDSPANVSVAGGALRLTARKEAAPFTCRDHVNGSFTTQYTSASVSTYDRFSQAFGRFEVRAKLPAVFVKGLQTSFWLWPGDANRYGPWPLSGEIDIAEVYTLHPDRAIPYLHYYASFLDWNVTNNYCLIDDISRFHTYTVEWTPTSITILYDGRACLVNASWSAVGLARPAPFDHPFMVALTQALGVSGTGNAFDPATTPLPATTHVDYVRVWR